MRIEAPGNWPGYEQVGDASRDVRVPSQIISPYDNAIHHAWVMTFLEQERQRVTGSDLVAAPTEIFMNFNGPLRLSEEVTFKSLRYEGPNRAQAWHQTLSTGRLPGSEVDIVLDFAKKAGNDRTIDIKRTLGEPNEKLAVTSVEVVAGEGKTGVLHHSAALDMLTDERTRASRDFGVDLIELAKNEGVLGVINVADCKLNLDIQCGERVKIITAVYRYERHRMAFHQRVFPGSGSQIPSIDALFGIVLVGTNGSVIKGARYFEGTVARFKASQQ